MTDGPGFSGKLVILGFTHYCSKPKSGKFRVKRRTSKKKFNKKLKEIHALLRDLVVIYGLPIKDVIKKLNQILVGYYHYYGITDNSEVLSKLKFRVTQILFKCLNRRSQKRSYNWEQFNDLLKDFPPARPKIYVSIYGTDSV